MTKHLLLVLLLGLTGCDRRLTASRQEFSLTAHQRTGLHLPPSDQLTLANPSDRDYAKTLPQELRNSVKAFLQSQHRNFAIVAARPTGQHVLLWITFPDVADGGIDLIYSTQERKIVGEFIGGIRG